MVWQAGAGASAVLTGGGCPSSNLVCNLSQILRDNYINQWAPRLNATTYKPAASGSGTYLGGLAKLWRNLGQVSFGPWAPGTGSGAIPAGTLLNSVPRDRAGVARGVAATDAPGCYVAPARTSEFWLPDGQPYAMNLPASMRHIWVDPVAGSNANSGATRGQALRTLAAAYLAIPPVRTAGPSCGSGAQLCWVDGLGCGAGAWHWQLGRGVDPAHQPVQPLPRCNCIRCCTVQQCHVDLLPHSSPAGPGPNPGSAHPHHPRHPDQHRQ